ncbi:MAG: NAD-dependent epimerase/dehydratase family protein [Gemmatimonadota bacterium]
MHVLITGGTGFIGSRLALRCLEEGHSVRVLGQENTPAEADNRARVEEAGAEVVLASVDDPGSLARVVERAETVFHLAAAQHEMNVPDEHFWNVNVRGTENLLLAAAEAGATRFVHGSTIGVYGVPDGPLDEESPTRPDNIYGTTKLAGEERVLALGDKIPVAVVRIPEVYGPGDRRLLKLFRSIEGGTFFLIGGGANLHHPIYVDDLVDGLLAAARSPDAVGEVLLLAGREPVTTRQMTEAIARAVGREPRRWHAPLLPFTAAAALLELTLRPLGIQPPLHRRRLDFFRKSHRLSAEKARRRLGFEPRVDFAEGARRTAEWYRSAGLL